jgi:hypothetical protein
LKLIFKNHNFYKKYKMDVIINIIWIHPKVDKKENSEYLKE